MEVVADGVRHRLSLWGRQTLTGDEHFTQRTQETEVYLIVVVHAGQIPPALVTSNFNQPLK